MHKKPTKLPVHWSSRIPKRYKRNAINGELHRAKRISSNFNKEVSYIKEKYLEAQFPERFIDSVIRQFKSKFQDKFNDEDDVIIPPNLFDEPKRSIFIEIPYCETNETFSKRFLNKFHNFTENKFNVTIKWKTKKVRNLFNLKDRNPYPACTIYKGTCTCGLTYIGETIRNAAVRWSEHNNPLKDSEPAKHISNYPDHAFNWKVLMNAPTNNRIRKNLEASIIATNYPKLNEQVLSKKLLLFRNGVT